MKLIQAFASAAFLFSAVGAFAADDVRVVERPTTGDAAPHYLANRAPLEPSPFLKLPLGAVKAEGWLGEALKRQNEGLAGKLGTISKWLEKGDNAWLMNGGQYGWEELPYWLRGYVDMAYLASDKEMIAEAQTWIEAIFKSQRADGYFGPGDPDAEKPIDIWPNMLVLFLMQSYYENTGDERVISFMSKYFDWIAMRPDERLLETYWENSRGGDMLHSCLWLYNVTGDKKLLAVAEKIHENTANWRQVSGLPNWHNVNIAQCFREPATFWQLSKDEADKAATYNNFWLIRAIYGQVPGGMWGGDEVSRQGYIDPRQGIETCAIFEQLTSNMLLFRATGDTFWADHAEEVAFNCAPAAMMPDFKALRYITCPNQPISDAKNHNPAICNAGPFMSMNPFSSRCCQHNHAHGWPYYVEHLWTATPDRGLAATLYGASQVTAKVGDGTTVTIKETTNYPFDDTVKLTVSLPQGVDSVKFPLYVRVPKWAVDASATINGEKLAVDAAPQKWIRVEREWKDGDTVAATFPAKFSYRKWRQNKDSVSVDYGPLTFSLKIDEEYRQERDGRQTAIGDSGWQEGADVDAWPSFEILPKSAWNYGLIDPATLDLSQLELVRKDWPENNFPWTTDAVPYSIKLKGRKIPSWGYEPTGFCETLPFSPAPTAEPVEELELIPMGAARLRISAFPTVEEK